MSLVEGRREHEGAESLALPPLRRFVLRERVFLSNFQSRVHPISRNQAVKTVEPLSEPARKEGRRNFHPTPLLFLFQAQKTRWISSTETPSCFFASTRRSRRSLKFVSVSSFVLSLLSSLLRRLHVAKGRIKDHQARRGKGRLDRRERGENVTERDEKESKNNERKRDETKPTQPNNNFLRPPPSPSLSLPFSEGPSSKALERDGSDPNLGNHSQSERARTSEVGSAKRVAKRNEKG